MTTVTVSPKFQVVIPKAVRDSEKVFSGMKMEVLPYDGRIVLIPIRPMREMMGFAKGMDIAAVRDETDFGNGASV